MSSQSGNIDLKKMMENIKNMDEGFIVKGLTVILLTIIGITLYYYYYKRNLGETECKSMNILYQDADNYIHSINYELEDSNYALRDYYIMTAYNACSGGSYKNDYVGLCPLKNVIKQGVRGLDFEIYSINDQPVVSTSTVGDSYYVKETYNYVAFSEVVATITSLAFSAATAPNPSDPIIIHLRIKSNNQRMFTNLASIFKNLQPNYLLGPKYNSEYNICDNANQNSACYHQNLGSVKLKTLNTKNGKIAPTIILIVDKSNNAFMENKDFYEFVNMTSNSMFMRKLNYYDVRYTPDMNELQEYNKKNMTISVPDNGVDPVNPSGIIVREMGCQLLAIRYQEFDEVTQENILFFNQAGSAFALKPEKLRFKEIYIEETPENPPELSFGDRTTSTDYYSFTT